MIIMINRFGAAAALLFDLAQVKDGAPPERHLERLRHRYADSLQTSSLHLDMLRDLKRLNAHIASVAHPILDESGFLMESRLRNAS